MTQLGKGEIVLVSVKWQPGSMKTPYRWQQILDLPNRVNVANLARVGPNKEWCNCG